MTTLSLQSPLVGQPNTTEDPKIITDLTLIQNWAGGFIDEANTSAAFDAKLGLGTGRGRSVIATSETRTNAAYGLLPTPDRVAGVTLPQDGYVIVGYQAMWQQSVSGGAAAALFLGANQLQVQYAGANAPVVQSAMTSGAAGINADLPLFTFPQGLATVDAPGAFAPDVSTGQAAGAVGTSTKQILAQFGSSGGIALDGGATVFSAGLCWIEAAAGTYDVSVQFKATTGSVTVKNRRLKVLTVGF
jgi:hypothetical protein